MICVPISRSSRGSSALTLACVPTGMKTGVSTTPCAVVNFPKRAFVCESVLRSSNIARRFNQNGAVEHEIFRYENLSNSTRTKITFGGAIDHLHRHCCENHAH